MLEKDDKITAIIVDDERNAREVLSYLLERTCPEVEVLDFCENLPDAVKSIHAHNPDVVFLDIQMPEYAGYEIIKFIEPTSFNLIFVTAFNEFAIKAFDLSAVDYLLKPVKRERLKEAVKRAKQKKQQEESLAAYNTLINNLDKNNAPQIVIKEAGGQRIIKLNQIVSVEGQRAYSEIMLKDGQRILVSKNLKTMEGLFEHFSPLVRCHKSWIVNVNEVNQILTGKNELLMSNASKAKISSNRVKMLKEHF